MHFYGFYWNTLVINRSIQELLEVEFPKKRKLQLGSTAARAFFPGPYPVLSVTLIFPPVQTVCRFKTRFGLMALGRRLSLLIGRSTMH